MASVGAPVTDNESTPSSSVGQPSGIFSKAVKASRASSNRFSEANAITRAKAIRATN